MARWLFCLAFLVGCADSHGTDDDDGIRFDASVEPDGSVADGGPDGATMPPPDLGACGDGALDPMEQCDDGNTADGDGCTATCRREQFCGDEMVSGGEVCDDGNTAGGDTCSPDCTAVMACGDGEVTEPEQCDDGNVSPWDQCGPDCRDEQNLVVSALELGDVRTGCDFSGDGKPDNSLARALGFGASFLGSMLDDAIQGGDVILLLSLLDLALDGEGTDESVSVAWLTGADTNDTPSDNLTGSGELAVDAMSVTADGAPLATLVGGVTNGKLGAGPEDLALPVGFLPLELRQGRVHGTLRQGDAGIVAIDDGLLCGAVSLATFALLPNCLGAIGGGGSAPACDGSGEEANFADILVAGTAPSFPLPLRGTAPDVDLDGDGLERFEVVKTGPEGCQPVITACVDGDGTRVEGHACSSDPRFADGFSTALTFEAVRAILTGIQ